MNKRRAKQNEAKASPSAGWRSRLGRPEVRFLALFVALLAGGFTAISLNPVNDRVIVPFTDQIARASAWVLNTIGEPVRLDGSKLTGQRFGVEILNGCNGVETMIIFVAAVLAFPARARARARGLAVGIVAIQALNLVRVVALFLTGSYFPTWFNSSHTVIWQSIVIGCGVLLFVFWASRFAAPRRPETA